MIIILCLTELKNFSFLLSLFLDFNFIPRSITIIIISTGKMGMKVVNTNANKNQEVTIASQPETILKKKLNPVKVARIPPINQRNIKIDDK